MKLTWKASPGDNASPGGVASGVVGYDVWRSAGVSKPIRLAGTTGLTHTDNATTRATTYTYFVKTFDGASYRSTGASPLEPVTV